MRTTSLERYEESLKIRREIGDRYGIAASLNNIGNVHSARGAYKQGLAAHEEALRIRREIGDRPGEVESLLSLARLSWERGEAGEAAARIEECLAIAREMGQRSVQAGALCLRGRLGLERGDGSARADAEQALKISEEAQSASLRAGALGLLARLDPSGAEAWLNEARGLVGPDRDVSSYLQFLEDEAASRRDREDPDGAARIAREGAALARRIGARPALAKFLFLAADLPEARRLAEELGIKPLLSRIDPAIEG